MIQSCDLVIILLKSLLCTANKYVVFAHLVQAQANFQDARWTEIFKSTPEDGRTDYTILERLPMSPWTRRTKLNKALPTTTKMQPP